MLAIVVRELDCHGIGNEGEGGGASLRGPPSCLPHLGHNLYPRADAEWVVAVAYQRTIVISADPEVVLSIVLWGRCASFINLAKQ